MTWRLLATGLASRGRSPWSTSSASLTAPPTPRSPSRPTSPPHGGCTDVIVRELRAAKHAVRVLAYRFTSRPIAQALVDAKLRGG
jgi:hypothetical protein